MSPTQFNEYLQNLSEDEFDFLIQERITRLNPAQQLIAQEREKQRKYKFNLINKLIDSDPYVHEMVFTILQEIDGDKCEHGCDYLNHCQDCGQIEHIMYPEVFDKDGFHIEEF